MAQATFREAHAVRSNTRESVKEKPVSADPRSLTITAYDSLEDVVSKIQALHVGDIESRTRTRVQVEAVSDDRVSFQVRHHQGRWDQTVMNGSLVRRGETTLVTAHIENSTQALWLIAVMVAGLLGLLLFIQINIPMMLMVGALPLLVLRDNLTERRGAVRLMNIVRQTFES